MNNLLDIFQWWGQHANFLPWMLDHWIITWLLSSLATAYFMGCLDATTGSGEELLGIIVMILFMPFILGIFIILLPFIAMLCVLVALLFTMFTLGAVTRRS